MATTELFGDVLITNNNTGEMVARFTNSNELIIVNSDAASTNGVIRFGEQYGMELGTPGWGRAQISAGYNGADLSKRDLWLNRDGGHVIVGTGDGLLEANLAANTNGTLAVAEKLMLGAGTGTLNTTSGIWTGGPVTAAEGTSSGVGFTRTPIWYESALGNAAVMTVDAGANDTQIHAPNTPAAYGRIIVDYTQPLSPAVILQYGYNVSGGSLAIGPLTVQTISKSVIRIETQVDIYQPVMKLSTSNFLNFNNDTGYTLIGNIADIRNEGGNSVIYDSVTQGHFFYIDIKDTAGTLVDTAPTVSGVYFVDFEILGIPYMIL